MERVDYENMWINKFKELNKRKPTKQEIIIFRVGFNAGEHYELHRKLNGKGEEQ
jgi:hypothetical protein